MFPQFKGKISLIAAMSENRVIGYRNRLPWHMPADWAHFRKVTKGKVFIMGRNSYEAEDALLSDKMSIILSQHAEITPARNCYRAKRLEEAFHLAREEKEVFILGGENVFRQTVFFADYIFLTIIHAQVNGDAFFPEFEQDHWILVKDQFLKKDQENIYNYSFREYQKIPS
jgi:dihydrofolate reductase